MIFRPDPTSNSLSVMDDGGDGLIPFEQESQGSYGMLTRLHLFKAYLQGLLYSLGYIIPVFFSLQV